MSDYIIRPAEPRDLEAVNDLLRDVLRVHHEGRPDLFRAEGKKYTDEELLGIFCNLSTPVFVYEKEGAVLGYVFCSLSIPSPQMFEQKKTLYIDDLCVNPKARGQHVGKALFEYVKEYAREQDCYNVTLHVWECNPGARAFYESFGMTPQYTSMEMILMK